MSFRECCGLFYSLKPFRFFFSVLLEMLPQKGSSQVSRGDAACTIEVYWLKSEAHHLQCLLMPVVVTVS